MKRLGILIAALAVGACATTKTQTPPPASPKTVPAAQLADDSGTSTDTAVLVPKDAPNDGFDFENEWIYNRYGKFRRQGGGTGTLNGHRYDVVEIELWGGEKKKVYFDITDAWNNWKPAQK